MDALYKQLRRHSILALGYTGLVNCGADKKHPVMQQLFRDYITVMMKSEKQLAALEKLLKAFEEKGIDYLPLKGINMKKLYPKPELRAMGDADVLIRKEQYEEIKQIVEAQGYENVLDEGNTKDWKSADLYVEFHINLVSEYDEDFLDYFKNGWSKGIKEEGVRYHFSKENEFLFDFIHFVKHFRYGGIGYRQFIDLWIYKREHPHIDYAFIEQEVEKLNLKNFYINIVATLKACFEEGPNSDVTDIISDYIVTSGNWGSVDRSVLSKGVKKQSTGETENKNLKIFFFFDSLFPKINIVRNRYPVLHKHPWLLPMMWIVRIFDAIFNRRDGIRQKMYEVKTINEEDVLTQKQMFDKIGLEFNF